MPTTTFTDPVPEASSRQYTTTLVDHDGAAIDPASVTSITLTLRDLRTGNIINSRENQNVKNANGGTLSAGGLFKQIFSPLDTAITGADGRTHKRRATFKVVYTPAGAENHEVIFSVVNLADVP